MSIEAAANPAKSSIALCTVLLCLVLSCLLFLDVQVPGAYTEAMNGNTKLGKAIRAACSELKTLNKLVRRYLSLHPLCLPPTQSTH